MGTTNLILHFLIYVSFLGICYLGKMNGFYRLFSYNGIFTTKPIPLIGMQLFGIIWLGFFPSIVMKHSFNTILIGNTTPDVYMLLLFILLFVSISGLGLIQSKSTFEKSPSTTNNFTALSSGFFHGYFLLRILYLSVYELWFRGFLLYDSVAQFGVLFSVPLNISLYVLTHIFTSKKEILACIPFGLTVCLLSIWFNAVWPAILLHIGFSIAFEFSFYQMNLKNLKISKS